MFLNTYAFRSPRPIREPKQEHLRLWVILRRDYGGHTVLSQSTGFFLQLTSIPKTELAKDDKSFLEHMQLTYTESNYWSIRLVAALQGLRKQHVLRFGWFFFILEIYSQQAFSLILDTAYATTTYIELMHYHPILCALNHCVVQGIIQRSFSLYQDGRSLSSLGNSMETYSTWGKSRLRQAGLEFLNYACIHTQSQEISSNLRRPQTQMTQKSSICLNPRPGNNLQGGKLQERSMFSFPKLHPPLPLKIRTSSLHLVTGAGSAPS